MILSVDWVFKKCIFIFFISICHILSGQNIVKGIITDAETGDGLIGATILIENTNIGTATDFDGSFSIQHAETVPYNIIISYTGYSDQKLPVTESEKEITVAMSEASIVAETVVVTGQRVSETQKKAPLTIESLDLLAIKETASNNFYDGLGTLKGVDLTSASLGFKIINTRGFNSTSPVRSLQIIDGVDNQAPGLNFSLGNFLGSSELDVLKVDLIVGASSAFYGPNAFNGVIKMDTKNPFLQKGLSAMVKFGERNMFNGAIRWADAFTNDEGHPWVAYKLNLEYLRADDWEAENFDPVVGSFTDQTNPGGFDAVNIYGDEYRSLFDQTTATPWGLQKELGNYYRKGYREGDLVDYDTRNIKSNAAVHFRLNPAKEFESPELILSSSFSNGTTVYQGENRFSLKDILFFQNRVELRKKDKYFIRAYMTRDDAGNSYDPYFTALLMQEASKSDLEWRTAYTNYWTGNIIDRIDATGYPQLEWDPEQGAFTFDQEALEAWRNEYQDSLFVWHAESNAYADQPHPEFEDFTEAAYQPGTARFDSLFNKITSTKSGDVTGGTRLIDRSSLYHLHGEYNFEIDGLNYLKLGSNARLYTPVSEGTIFVDTADVVIRNFEYGVYAGAEKSFLEDKFILSATMRMDKNQNFRYLFSPAASLVYNPAENHYIRVSFSSAVRNPTLTDQYLDFNVGPATLRGNIDGVDSLITLESFNNYRNELNRDTLEYFSLDPIQPEEVRSFELGYRTTLFEKLFVDASYYYSIYDNFIGYQIGLLGSFDPVTGFPVGIRAFRYSSNSLNTVTTQGFSIGLNYYFADYYKIGGNYSWNVLNTQIDDPIIPAFNTPEHKYNVTFSGRNIPLRLGGLALDDVGFNINYKWVEGFIFEGSPQFTGPIDSYALLDAQVNYNFDKLNTSLKIGASNILNNQVYQTYGGPRIGRLAYIKMLYEFQKK